MRWPQEEEEASDDADDAESFDGRATPVAVEQVVIMGGGPAGLAASVYAARAGLKPLVVGTHSPVSRASSSTQGGRRGDTCGHLP